MSCSTCDAERARAAQSRPAFSGRTARGILHCRTQRAGPGVRDRVRSPYDRGAGRVAANRRTAVVSAVAEPAARQDVLYRDDRLRICAVERRRSG